MKLFNKTVSLLTAFTLLVSSIPCSAARGGGGSAGHAAREWGQENGNRYNAELQAAGSEGAGRGYEGGYGGGTSGANEDTEELEFDGQAYSASRYVPALRPHVMVGTLLVIALIVVLLQNHHHHSKGHLKTP